MRLGWGLLVVMTGDAIGAHAGDGNCVSLRMTAKLGSLSSSSCIKIGTTAVDWVLGFVVTVPMSSSSSWILLLLVNIGDVV